MKQTQKYPIGVQSFRWLREEEYIYIDKTSILYNLVSNGKYYFMSRPRRFGKSLLLSTLESYFLGEKELFKGLAMEKLEREWHRYPVLHLDLSAYIGTGENSLESILERYITDWENSYGLEPGRLDFSNRFHNVIKAAHEQTGRRAVILIDEYDAPMIAHMDDDDRFAEVRDLLRSIYMNLKICDQHIQFSMITGVSRFSKVSVFSGLNNLNDISLDRDYGEICGVTEKELSEYFQPGVNLMAEELGIEPHRVFELLKDNYDGYHFTRNSADIYNPFSLLNALAKRDIGLYWYQSGRATMIVDRIRKMPGLLSDILDNEEASAATITDAESYTAYPTALLFQAGYITIKGYNPEDRIYTLGLPNREVRQGLLMDLTKDEFPEDTGMIQSRIWDIRNMLRKGNPDEALSAIRTFLSRVPYDIAPKTPEVYFENSLYLIFSLVGIDARAEWRHSSGRVDMLLMMKDYIYLMELKLDGTAEQALAQIDEKGYAMPFADDPRRLFRIGINFSKDTRNIDSWIIQG